jgi:hypothetical protein
MHRRTRGRGKPIRQTQAVFEGVPQLARYKKRFAACMRAVVGRRVTGCIAVRQAFAAANIQAQPRPKGTGTKVDQVCVVCKDDKI